MTTFALSPPVHASRASVPTPLGGVAAFATARALPYPRLHTRWEAPARMAQVSVDRQSLLIDGRRVWLVGGTFDYARTPHPLWPARLRLMRQAGLNTVCLPVPWARHEPRRGHFDFSGDLDLPGCLALIGGMGLRVILRAGPAIDDGWDFGGLPGWLAPITGGRVRGTDPEYLKSCASWFAVLATKVKDHQAAGSRKRSGPILLVQTEHRYHCGSEALTKGYLAELDRFLRENGVSVPVINTNGLFTSVEGQIDGWTGSSHLHANMRQLRFLRPDQPRILASLRVGCADVWGEERRNRRTPTHVMRQAVEALAAGAQFVLDPFVGGTNFGFSAGRLDDGAARFVTTSHDGGAPVSEAGAPTAAYFALRRAAMFASHFEGVLSAIDPEWQPAAVALDSLSPPIINDETGERAAPAKSAAVGAALSVIHQSGPQGGVAFVFGREGEKNQSVSLVLPDGSTLPVALGEQGVAWVLLGAHLFSKSRLDYCNLNAFAAVGSIFVCFGPAGAPGLISINGAAMEVIVPDGLSPHVEQLEGVMVVVCNEDAIDAVTVGESSVFIGAGGVNEQGVPIPHPKFKSVTRLSASGDSSVMNSPAPSAAAGRVKVTLGPWSSASCEEHASGSSVRFASIPGPASLAELGAESGYGWLRLRFKAAPGAVKAGLFHAGDRLHCFLDGAPLGVFGLGPGADDGLLPLALKKPGTTLVALADNLGRFSSGTGMGESKGLFGHLWAVKPLRAGPPKLATGKPMSPIDFAASLHVPCFGVEDGEVTDARRIAWTFEHRRQSPVFLTIDPPDGGARNAIGPAVLIFNGEPIALLPTSGRVRLELPGAKFSKGKNTVEVAVMGGAEHALTALKEGAAFFEGESCLSEKADWSFAKWEPPARWDGPKKGEVSPEPRVARKGFPAWWRAEFTLDRAPLAPMAVEPIGLSKGQLFVNGHNLGRYWAATPTGKRVPPQDSYIIPECWLRAGANELVLFDEHGNSPAKLRIASA